MSLASAARLGAGAVPLSLVHLGNGAAPLRRCCIQCWCALALVLRSPSALPHQIVAIELAIGAASPILSMLQSI